MSREGSGLGAKQLGTHPNEQQRPAYSFRLLLKDRTW